MNKSEQEEEKEDRQGKQILGINIIETLVSRVISNPDQILAGLKQIFFFYNYLPQKWKRKAFFIFDKLWKRKQVFISTDPEKGNRIYNLDFDNDEIKQLFEVLPDIDKAILLQGREMQLLINKGLHGDSDEIKREVEKRYGQRGLNIVNMLTTNDIEYFLLELKKPYSKETQSTFNDWVNKYDSISLLISPSEIYPNENLKKRIVQIAKKNIKKYILINLSGKVEDCTSIINLITEMKDKKELNYTNFNPDIKDSGFCKSLRIKMNF